MKETNENLRANRRGLAANGDRIAWNPASARKPSNKPQICAATLVALRNACGMSHADLARASGVNKRTLIRYEKPEYQGRQRGTQVRQIAAAFGLKASDLAAESATITVAHGEFVPIRTEIVQLYEREGEVHVRHVRNPTFGPHPDYRYITMMEPTPGHLVVRSPVETTPGRV